MRTRLVTTIDHQFDQELERMLDRMRQSVGPYTRLVASEVQRLEKIEENMTTINTDIASIRAEIENLFNS